MSVGKFRIIAAGLGVIDFIPNGVGNYASTHRISLSDDCFHRSKSKVVATKMRNKLFTSTTLYTYISFVKCPLPINNDCQKNV